MVKVRYIGPYDKRILLKSDFAKFDIDMGKTTFEPNGEYEFPDEESFNRLVKGLGEAEKGHFELVSEEESTEEESTEDESSDDEGDALDAPSSGLGGFGGGITGTP